MDCSQPLLSVKFSRQECWTGVGSHFLLLGISNPGIEHEEELIYNIIVKMGDALAKFSPTHTVYIMLDLLGLLLNIES